MMPASKYFFLGLALYLLYRFIVNFVIPVVKTTRQVRRQFRDMRDAVNGQNGPFQQGEFQQAPFQPFQQQEPRPQTQSQKPANNQMGEYIDFEEVK